jgi:radical SAM superfamily enzyme YgiQ (UPF0313 family)
MRVLLVAANTERINMVALPVGLGLVAAATRQAGHEVTFVDLLETPDPSAALRGAIASSRPEVIGLSIRNIDDQSSAAPRLLLEQARSVMADCRALSQAPVVLGGPGYSIFPAEVLDFLGADFGVWGDGEAAFPAMLERIARGEDPCEVAGVLARGASMPAHRATAAALDALPLWEELCAWKGDRADPNLWVPVQSRRGCPNDCSYCSTARVQGRTIRARSPSAVVAHIGRLAQAGFRRFYLVDNSFNIPEPHALELCRLLGELDPLVDWRCILYPEHVSEPLIAAMARAGCKEVALGFESGCQRILQQMNKRYGPDEVRAASDLLLRYGIRRMGFLLLGGPGETRESVEESLAFAASLHLDALRVTVGIRIYPGTALARRAVADGMIESESDLLVPKFYLAKGLEPWLRARVAGLG